MDKVRNCSIVLFINTFYFTIAFFVVSSLFNQKMSQKSVYIYSTIAVAVTSTVVAAETIQKKKYSNIISTQLLGVGWTKIWATLQ